MSHRPLVLVSGLTVGDYLLWSWSLSGNHEVLALVSGLTLPPLAVAGVWLLVLSIARVIAQLARRSHARRARARRAHAPGPDVRRSLGQSARAQGSPAAREEALVPAGSPDPPSRTLAA